MEEVARKLTHTLEGDIKTDIHSRQLASHDASIYELLPAMVIEPKNENDIKKLVSFVSTHQALYPSLSLTPRSAGTDMTGGAIGASLVLDMTKHFSTIHRLSSDILHVEPGVYMRDIDPLLSQHHRQLGFEPASRALCTIGGMVANNAGGEQSLRYGNANRWVSSLRVVLSDGNVYTIKPLTKRQLDKKMSEHSFEGTVYRRMFELIEQNYDVIRNAYPQVNKFSTGYNLWHVWDRETGIFDMTQLFSGSQGTLGIITDLSIKTVEKATYSKRIVAYVSSLRQLADIITVIRRYQPATLEGFDDITFSLGVRHFKTLRKQLGTKEYLRQQARLIGAASRLRGHIPNIFLTIEFDGDNEQTLVKTIADVQKDLKQFRVHVETFGNNSDAEHFWTVRRAAFHLLRTQGEGKYATPFIDDMAVPPQYLPQFITELRRIIRNYSLPVTIQGHFGDANFHIIPLLDISRPQERAKLEPILREMLPFIKKYNGTMSAEHNDGMIRGPWLPAQFGQELYSLFRKTKEIFDPHYLFNPHKKTDASWDFSTSHIRRTNGN